MAAPEVQARGAQVKLRNPVNTALLQLVPIYGLVWFYRINREMRDYGQQVGNRELAEINPTTRILMVVPGFILLFIPPIIAYVWTVQSIKATQRSEGHQDLNGIIILLLFFIPYVGGLIAVHQLQQGLTGAWESASGNVPAGGIPGQGQVGAGFGAVPNQAPGGFGGAPAAPGAAPAGWGAPAPGAPPAPAAAPAPPAPAAVAAPPKADWYPDPQGQARLRYFDGTNWTEHTSE